MKHCDVLVLGGGPAGLSAAYSLNNAGIAALVYDKNDMPGGLCRSFTLDGYTFDTFAHVNFCKDEYALSMLEGKTEYLVHQPEAYNYCAGTWVRNPVQNNLLPLDIDEKIRVIKSFIQRDEDLMPKNYGEWLEKQYGKYFAENYPAKYTRKYWTVEPEFLETKWVEGRMYTPTIDEVLEGAMSSEVPNVHYSKEMHYPLNGGFGAFLRPFIEASFNGKKELCELNINEKVAVFTDGDKISYDKLLSTIPLDILINSISDVMVPKAVKEAVDELDYTSGVMVSIGLKKQHTSPALWFYIYDEDIHPARVYCPDIKSVNNVPEGGSALQAEIYFSKRKPLTKSLEELKEQTISQLIQMELFEKEDIVITDVRAEKYANIMFTEKIYSARRIVHDYLDALGICYAGRFGEWDYLWFGQSILSGKRAAEKIIESRYI